MSPHDLDDRDVSLLEARGIEIAEAQRQLELLADPPPPTRLLRPCTAGDGILVLRDDERQRLLERFEGLASAAATAPGRFVPASGAASRMFRDLRLAIEATPDDVDSKSVAVLDRLIDHLDRFPFEEELTDAMTARGLSATPPLSVEEKQAIARTLLDSPGLALASRPKGLVPFHKNREGRSVSALEEHLLEAAAVTANARSPVAVQFTVLPQHDADFKALLGSALPAIENQLGRTFEVSLSQQLPSTDTLALTSEGTPARRQNGELLLRPGGHGALIFNLDQLAHDTFDLVLIKNVDNIQPGHRQQASVTTQRLLLALAAELVSACQSHVEALADPSRQAVEAASRFARERLELALPKLPEYPQEAADKLIEALDRPLRVCGMVRNEGEPGGGPFWTVGSDGESSKQIVEASQIDVDDPTQRKALEAATHFNPVLLAAALRNGHGRAYDLRRFVDPSTSFVSDKSEGARALRVLERPGLWNGAMAFWNTVFVEVPIESFSPVKTLFDLLRPEHQG